MGGTIGGNLNVNGLTTLGGNVGLKFWKVTGTAPPTTVAVDIPLPNGCYYSNVVGFWGTYVNTGCFIFPLNNTFNYTTSSTGWDASIYLQANGNFHIDLATAHSTNVVNCAITIIVVTIS